MVGFLQVNSTEVNSTDTARSVGCTMIPEAIKLGWAKHPGNLGSRLSYKIMHKLNQLYILGKEQKRRKTSAKRALQIVVDEIVFNDWNERLNVTVPEIKAFFP